MTTDRTEQPPRAPIVLVTPTVPLAGSNGLAMRAGMLLDALAAAAPVHVVVVPVSGPAEPSTWARGHAASVTTVDWVHPDQANAHVVVQLANAEWRAALEATVPLPARATLAPPSLAPPAAGLLAPLLAGERPPAVVAMREYLAPFGIALARALGAARIVVDLDDDVEPLLEQLGEHDEAAAYGRLARAWLPHADAVTLASPVEAEAVAARYRLPVVHAVPNSMRPAIGVVPGPGCDRLLFVATLTYGPNADAARLLATEVLPALRADRPGATLDLVGHAGGAVEALAERDAVTVHGFVADLDRFYTAADVVVAPLASGAGTRIKVLEAFAHRRPVVVTPAAVAGLSVRNDNEVLVAETSADIARAVGRVLADDALADALVHAAAETLEARYAPDVVAPLVRRAVLGEEAGDER